jgi:hypothetical protein
MAARRLSSVASEASSGFQPGNRPARLSLACFSRLASTGAQCLRVVLTCRCPSQPCTSPRSITARQAPAPRCAAPDTPQAESGYVRVSLFGDGRAPAVDGVLDASPAMRHQLLVNARVVGQLEVLSRVGGVPARARRRGAVDAAGSVPTAAAATGTASNHVMLGRLNAGGTWGRAFSTSSRVRPTATAGAMASTHRGRRGSGALARPVGTLGWTRPVERLRRAREQHARLVV